MKTYQTCQQEWPPTSVECTSAWSSSIAHCGMRKRKNKEKWKWRPNEAVKTWQSKCLNFPATVIYLCRYYMQEIPTSSKRNNFKNFNSQQLQTTAPDNRLLTTWNTPSVPSSFFDTILDSKLIDIRWKIDKEIHICLNELTHIFKGNKTSRKSKNKIHLSFNLFLILHNIYLQKRQRVLDLFLFDFNTLMLRNTHHSS